MLGQPEAIQTENGFVGPGAIWDLSSLINNGQLRPGEQTSTRRLTFKITGFQPISGNRDRGGTALQFEAKTYAKKDTLPANAR